MTSNPSPSARPGSLASAIDLPPTQPIDISELITRALAEH